MNKTLEDMYTGLLQEHDTIQASNPWGCNQYGHRKGHQGNADSVSEKSRGKSDSDEKQGPAKLPNGAFNIPGLKKPLAVPTPNPGEKNAPVLKPKDMSDKDFREAQDLDNPYRSNLSKEEANKKIVVKTLTDAKDTLKKVDEKLNGRELNINDPLSLARINLQYEIERLQKYDNAKEAERLISIIDRAKKLL